MTCDLQRANVWKRISAFLFDVILLAIACVLCAWGLSALLKFDAQYQTLMARYQAVADACGLDMSIMTQTYSALTDAQRALVEQAPCSPLMKLPFMRMAWSFSCRFSSSVSAYCRVISY